MGGSCKSGLDIALAADGLGIDSRYRIPLTPALSTLYSISVTGGIDYLYHPALAPAKAAKK